MTKYVCGFAFNYDRVKVVLIEKLKPEWQKGLLNGVGGHIEEGETELQAMQREFKEETGISVWVWNLFCTYTGEGYCVYFFKSFTVIEDVKSVTKEQVGIFHLEELDYNKTIPNLKWLIPLALDIEADKSIVKGYLKGE